MAQNEGRTLRRAPKLTYSHVLFFMLALAVSVLFGLLVHTIKVAAEAQLTTQTVETQQPQTNSGTRAVAATAELTKATSQSCTRITYHLPSAINLSSLPEGVTTIEDAPQRYTIYGNTVEDQRDQLQRCAPVDEFAGAASYQVSWMYAYSVRADGLCEIVQPKIGLHLNMVLPSWSNTSRDATEASTAWQTFSTNLNTHEQGHYRISKQYAQAMFEQLRHVPPQACSTIQSTADGVLNTTLQQLQTAQNNYDTTTAHGATQGAVL